MYFVSNTFLPTKNVCVLASLGKPNIDAETAAFIIENAIAVWKHFIQISLAI
jgi:hypothetical protein